MNITIADIKGEEEYIMPHVPADIEHGGTCGNSTMNTLDGNIRIIGERELIQVGWSGILPVNKNYSWQKYGSLLDGAEYVKFFENMMNYKLPVRVVITDSDDITLLNSLMSIDSFVHASYRVNDFSMFLSMTDFTLSYSVVNDDISVSRLLILRSSSSSLAVNFAFIVVYSASACAIPLSSDISLINVLVE